jgi:hypothetical protein
MSIKALRLPVLGRTGPGMKAAAQIAGGSIQNNRRDDVR